MFPPPVLNFVGNKMGWDGLIRATSWFILPNPTAIWIFGLMILFFSYFQILGAWSPRVFYVFALYLFNILRSLIDL